MRMGVWGSGVVKVLLGSPETPNPQPLNVGSLEPLNAGDHTLMWR